MSMWTRGFWKGTAERAISSAALGAVAAWSLDLGIHEMDLQSIASLGAAAGVLSVLKALAAISVTGTASLVGAEVPAASVVEKVTANDTIVAGPANDMARPGKPIRKENHHVDGTPLAPAERRP